ncbi:hypothetical protein DUNSADRAFT_8028 [Dunaliella salina]|uniref:Encoded protein n=1 Tax=Dunaliella salina TaxID=3046 RepID=A0ABQ7GK76_DUNSA|nr:hypothetical protein DUNSADRAFT_8028 [Dunaliella salina]|eukprot:KAF5835025.1 hypothetical protein DUNSADRAFT_8028 [Dunaliella salina]
MAMLNPQHSEQRSKVVSCLHGLEELELLEIGELQIALQLPQP